MHDLLQLLINDCFLAYLLACQWTVYLSPDHMSIVSIMYATQHKASPLNLSQIKKSKSTGTIS